MSEDLKAAAQAVVDRWDSPRWKDAEHTGVLIGRLREALNQQSVSDAYQLPATPAQDKGSEG